MSGATTTSTTTTTTTESTKGGKVFPGKFPRTFVPQATAVHRMTNKRDIPYYRDFISDSLLESLQKTAEPVPNVSGLCQVGKGGGLETDQSLLFLCALYDSMKEELHNILAQRLDDRSFIDLRTKACSQFNGSLNVDFLAAEYETIIGHEDAKGRIVVGPLNEFFCKPGYSGKQVEEIPAFLKGPHVTLFGPPDTAKICVDAMNTFHQKLADEPAIISELLGRQCATPKWGADHEDSKTPLRVDLVQASSDLSACFDGSLTYTDAASGATCKLEDSKRSFPIKRFPGLALPAHFLLYNGQPLPLHMYDFALHLHKHWNNPEALSFYVPKLENEEEARYLCHLFQAAELAIQKLYPTYKTGTIKVIVVVENPRALFRVNEIIDELHPFFVGTSLGWHDFLASTARLFKEDPNYRVPVKADPNIVIRNIVGSHHLLADVVGARGGIKIGGMYGVLPIDNNLKSPSFQVTMKGFIRDLVSQLKRNLDGFWVAQPEFVRVGLAIVQGWEDWKSGNKESLFRIVTSLLEEQHQQEVIAFIEGPDSKGLDQSNAMYTRSLLVMDKGVSQFIIANNHPDEVRYNVFQCLQYLADWLSGNACVALPAQVAGVPVRVLDDLATAERSRWEVWLEIHHGRFAVEDLIAIAHEELDFIRADKSTASKIVQVKWDSRTDSWYPIAFKIMLLLMTADKPREFATELMLPFTVDSVRNSPNAWDTMFALDRDKYSLSPYVQRLCTYYNICPSVIFCKRLAQNIVLNIIDAEEAFKELSSEDLRGLLHKTGDRPMLAQEHESEKVLWNEVFAKLQTTPGAALYAKIEASMKKHAVVGGTMTITAGPGKHYEDICIGDATLGKQRVTETTRFEVASLSKSVGSCFAINYFKSRGIPLTQKVNELLATTASPFRIPSGNAAHPTWGDNTTLAHCMSHCALNMHYVNGIPLKDPMPNVLELMNGSEKYNYVSVCANKEPGTAFGYSGGGHMVIEHLIEALEEKPIAEITAPFLEKMGMSTFSFDQKSKIDVQYATGYSASGEQVEGSRQMHPAFAAGGLGTAHDIAVFLNELTDAFQNADYDGAMTHDTAVSMLYGTDVGSQAFMGAFMGLGIFIAEAGPNRIAIHQGANAGFRSLFMHCVHGPDVGKGFNMHVNAELNGVFFISEVAQMILNEFRMEGVDTSQFQETFSLSNVPAEQIVNIGYKELIFKAFIPDLPEQIDVKGPRDPLADFNLAVGGRIISSTNQRFARACNMLSDHLPTFDPELFGRQGKIMDSWESVRHNQKPCDTTVFEMIAAAKIQYIALSTQFHLGNQAEGVSVDGRVSESSEWLNLIPRTHLEGHSEIKLVCKEHNVNFRYIRVSIYPDGGFSRIGLFNDSLSASERVNFKPIGEAALVRFTADPPQTLKPLAPTFHLPSEEDIRYKWAKLHGYDVDAASLVMGGSIARASNEHYGPAIQIISPFPPLSMFDGLESARSRELGHFENVIVKLGIPCRIHRMEVDCTYFVNNSPLELSIEATTDKNIDGAEWTTLVDRHFVKHFFGNCMVFNTTSEEEFRHVRFTAFPDGGFNRVRVYTKN